MRSTLRAPAEDAPFCRVQLPDGQWLTTTTPGLILGFSAPAFCRKRTPAEQRKGEHEASAPSEEKAPDVDAVAGTMLEVHNPWVHLPSSLVV
eukprot:6370167-Amphidinium_carterae.1